MNLPYENKDYHHRQQIYSLKNQNNNNKSLNMLVKQNNTITILDKANLQIEMNYYFETF